MPSLYLRYRLHLREQELTFLGMVTTFSECISLECVQQKFRAHFNKSIERKTLIDYFNYIKVRVTVNYDLCFSYDKEPKKLKYCNMPRELLQDKKFCKRHSIIVDVLQVSITRFDRSQPAIHYQRDNSDYDLISRSFQFEKVKVYMLIASCNGKVLFCKTYTNYNDILLETDKMFTKLCDDISSNYPKYNNRFIFILGPSLPASESPNRSISAPMESLTSESLTSEGIDVAPKYESTRVENFNAGFNESFSHIGPDYLLSRGHSVIVGGFNATPYLTPLLEVAGNWKSYLESKLKHCKNISKVLRDSEVHIFKSNFKKYLKNFPAIS